MKSLELFAGAGGLALGIAGAGFDHEAVIEWDKNACETIRENQKRGLSPISHWRLFESDVRQFDFSPFSERLDLLSGGPPCQPFSLGGKHKGQRDSRDMFPEASRAVREIRPRAFLFENVKGLLRSSFAKYFEYVLLQLTYPEIPRKKSEDWSDHLARLERYHIRGRPDGLFYRVVFRLLNAADYGVPQKRERVIIVGFRCDQNLEWSFPKPTHSQDALLWSQWITGEYWERHGITEGNRPALPMHQKTKIDDFRNSLFPPREEPWRTTRDAIADLPEPHNSGQQSNILNHQFNPGAKIYPGHTGSLLDEPAKTLKAGDHGVPGGENMLLLPNREVRYFTVRESARLQTFPDEYLFRGSWTETMRQLGNAVPVQLGNAIAASIHSHLNTRK